MRFPHRAMLGWAIGNTFVFLVLTSRWNITSSLIGFAVCLLFGVVAEVLVAKIKV